MKVALIGVGHWGRNHLKIYSELKEKEIIEDIIIFDKITARAKRLADIFQVKHEKSIRKILQNKEIMMASIVTPSPSHYELAMKFLEAGKDILVEKPLALTSKESWELVRRSTELNRILLPGHLFRFHNALLELKKVVKRGDLGKPIQINIERTAFNVPREDMGVLHALAIHDVDISCFLLDQEYPKDISAYATSYYRKYPDETATIFLDFDDGTASILNESWLNPINGKIRKLLLIGTRGSAQINFLVPDSIELIDTYIDNNEGKTLNVVREGTREKRVKPSEPLRNEIIHFVNSSLNGNEVAIPAEIGARAVEMIEIALESIKTKKTVNVEKYFQQNSSG